MSRFLIPSALALCLVATAGAAQQADSPYAAVDPMIGTGGEGHAFPVTTAPFGMIQLSPDTDIKPFKQSYKWAAGYRSRFSHATEIATPGYYIEAGGELRFVMQAIPNRNWATTEAARPFSMTGYSAAR